MSNTINSNINLLLMLLTENKMLQIYKPACLNTRDNSNLDISWQAYIPAMFTRYLCGLMSP